MNITPLAQDRQLWATARPVPPRPSGALPAVEALDAVLDLSNPQRDLFGAIRNLDSPEEVAAFAKMLSSLLSQGIVGVETREVNDEPYQSFVTVGMGDERLRGGRNYDKEEIRPRFDERV